MKDELRVTRTQWILLVVLLSLLIVEVRYPVVRHWLRNSIGHADGTDGYYRP